MVQKSGTRLETETGLDPKIDLKVRTRTNQKGLDGEF